MAWQRFNGHDYSAVENGCVSIGGDHAKGDFKLDGFNQLCMFFCGELKDCNLLFISSAIAAWVFEARSEFVLRESDSNLFW